MNTDSLKNMFNRESRVISKLSPYLNACLPVGGVIKMVRKKRDIHVDYIFDDKTYYIHTYQMDEVKLLERGVMHDIRDRIKALNLATVA